MLICYLADDIFELLGRRFFVLWVKRNPETTGRRCLAYPRIAQVRTRHAEVGRHVAREALIECLSASCATIFVSCEVGGAPWYEEQSQLRGLLPPSLWVESNQEAARYHGVARPGGALFCAKLITFSSLASFTLSVGFWP